MERMGATEHMPNSDMLTNEQKRLFWAIRTIEKFKEYDKKRTEVFHKLEKDYQVLRKRYEELEEYLRSAEEQLSKADKRRARKVVEYDKLMRGEIALQFMQKRYMVDGEYTPEFSAFLHEYNAALQKERLEKLTLKDKKLEKENRELLYELIKCKEKIREFEQKQNEAAQTEEI